MRNSIETMSRIGRRVVGTAFLLGGLLGLHDTAAPRVFASMLTGSNVIERAVSHEVSGLTSLEKSVGHALSTDYREATHGLTVEHHQQARQLHAETAAQTAAIRAQGKVEEQTLQAQDSSVNAAVAKDEQQLRQMARYLKAHHLAAQAISAQVASESSLATTAAATTSAKATTRANLTAALQSLRAVNPSAFDQAFPKVAARLAGATAGRPAMHFDHILGEQTLAADTPKVPGLCLEKGYHSRPAAGHHATSTGHRRSGPGNGEQGISPAPVPEPGALACGLLALGFGAWMRRPRRPA